jgi:SAM-dependent methyltransferase
MEEFDRYKDTYTGRVQDSIGFLKQDLSFYTEAKVCRLLSLARELGDPAGLRALDVGCGVGITDELLAPHLGALHGVDVSAGVMEAAARLNPSVRYTTYDGATLPFEDGGFDMTFAICVLHHVPPVSWSSFVGEMERVVRPGGLVVLIEHNPFNPLTRVAVARCSFDEDAVLLRKGAAKRLLAARGLSVTDQAYILFFPWSFGPLQRAERWLRCVPLGAQYVVAARKQPASGATDRVAACSAT